MTSPGQTSPTKSPGKLLQMKKEREEQERAEQDKMQALEKQKAGASLKNAKSFTLEEWPGDEASMYARAKW